MNRKIIIIPLLLISILIILLVFISLFIIDFKKFKNDLITMQINNVDLNKVKDGNYEGYLDKKYITAKVNVKVKKHKIVAIDILEHKHGPNKKYGADSIVDKIISKQSLDVDAVSGATGSSKVIRKAVEIALNKGL